MRKFSLKNLIVANSLVPPTIYKSASVGKGFTGQVSGSVYQFGEEIKPSSGSFKRGEASIVRQTLVGESADAPEYMQGVSSRRDFASLNANDVLAGKGRKNRRSPPPKTLLRRCQSRPKHCLGETYADHFLATFGCFVGPSLLTIYLVARGQSAR